ncbi:hypothetical protein J6590_051620 [Homalodisca vitripennis]|nr:hypothetical protein J6590_051620 [Homalodisca vitripennis]
MHNFNAEDVSSQDSVRPGNDHQGRSVKVLLLRYVSTLCPASSLFTSRNEAHTRTYAYTEYSVDPHTLQWRRGKQLQQTTATVERRLQWRRGKQLQQWNVAYSGDEENNCNSGTSLTVATRKTTATVERRLQWRRGKQLQQ